MPSKSYSDRLVKRKRLAKNAVFSGITSLADIFLLILLILCGRFLGTELFGVFTYALAVTTLLVFLTNLGLDSLAIRKIAIDRKKASFIIGSVLTWKLIISITAMVIFLLISNVFIDDEVTMTLLYILAPASILRSCNMTFRSFIQAFELFHIETSIVLLERSLLFSIGLFTLCHFKDPISLGWSFLISRGITAIVYVYTIQSKICHFKPKFNFKFISDFQKEAFPLGVATILFGIYSQIDVVMLGAYVTPDSIGLFSSAMKIYEGALVIPLIINSVLYPRLSSLFEHEKYRFHDLLNRGFKYLLIIAVLSSTIGLFYSGILIKILFGIEFIRASLPLTILIISVSISFLLALVHTAFRAMGIQKLVMYIMGIGLLIKFVINLLLIPNLGIIGAALTVLISTIIMTSIAIYVLTKKNHNLQDIIGSLIKTIASSIFAIVISDIIFTAEIFKMFSSVIIFIIGIFIFRVFDKFELELMNHLIPIFPRRN